MIGLQQKNWDNLFYLQSTNTRIVDKFVIGMIKAKGLRTVA
jgi:hypothetical protein